MALELLEGFGDRELGEWQETGTAFHLRRRLSAAEEKRIGPAVDLRDTEEAVLRFAVANTWMPKELLDFACMEIVRADAAPSGGAAQGCGVGCGGWRRGGGEGVKE